MKRALICLALASPACLGKDGPVDDSSPTDDFCAGAGAEIVFPEGPLGGDLPFEVRLTHPDAHTASLTLSVAVGDEGWRPMTLLAGEVAGLASGPEGVAHAFTWDTAADLGRVNVGGVRVAAQAVSACGPWALAELNQLDIVNEELVPAVCTVSAQTPTGTQEGSFDVRFTLAHPDAPEARVTLDVSTDGGGSFSAMSTAAEDCDGDGALDELDGLETSAEGVEHCVRWLSEEDISGDEDEVVVRVSCLVADVLDSTALTDAFSVHNDPVPDPGELIISEMMITPSQRDGEYLELLNLSRHTLNLNGLEIKSWYAGDDPDRDAPVDSHRVLVSSGDLSLAPGERALLASDLDPGANGCLSPDHAWGSDLALEDDAILALDAGGQRVALLSFTDAEGWSVPRRAALSLDPGAEDPALWTSPGAWCPAVSAIPACADVPDQTDKGTPGLANDPCN